MDLAESGVIWKVLIKGRGAEILSKICPSPFFENPLKFPIATLFPLNDNNQRYKLAFVDKKILKPALYS
jgi:hypothetical protein